MKSYGRSAKVKKSHEKRFSAGTKTVVVWPVFSIFRSVVQSFYVKKSPSTEKIPI